MRKLYELKEALCDELENYAGRGLTRQSVAEIDTLAHACKNICKIIDYCERSENRESGEMSSHDSYSKRFPNTSYRVNGHYQIDSGKGGSHEIADELRKIAEKHPDSCKEEVMRMVEKVRNLEE